MITIDLKTENGMETWQAAKKEDGWHIRKEPNLQWSDTPYCHSDAKREDVIQLLRKEKDIRY